MIRIFIGSCLLLYFALICIVCVSLLFGASNEAELDPVAGILVHSILFGIPGILLVLWGHRARRRGNLPIDAILVEEPTVGESGNVFTVRPLQSSTLAEPAVSEFANVVTYNAPHNRALLPHEKDLIEAFRSIVDPDPKMSVFPSILESQIECAKHWFRLPKPTERLICQIDNTFSGSSSDGCILTTRGIYWKNPYESGGHRNYEQIDIKTLSYAESFLCKKIQLEPSVVINLDHVDKKTSVVTLANFIRFAAATTIQRKDLIAAAERTVTDEWEKATQGDPTPTEHFECAGCGTTLNPVKAGTVISCRVCGAILSVPRQMCCPKCGSDKTAFDTGYSWAESMVGTIVGAAVAGPMGAMIGGQVGQGDAAYSCSKCDHRWSLRLRSPPE